MSDNEALLYSYNNIRRNVCQLPTKKTNYQKYCQIAHCICTTIMYNASSSICKLSTFRARKLQDNAIITAPQGTELRSKLFTVFAKKEH